MGNLKDLRGKLNALATEMSDLHKKGDERTAEEESRFDAVIAEFNDLGPKVEAEEARSAAVAQAEAMQKRQGSAARSLAGQTAITEGGREEIDTRSMGRRFAESQQVKDYRERGAQAGQSDPFGVNSFYHREGGIVHRDGMSPQEVRALITSAGLPASLVAPQIVNGFFRGDDLQGSIRDVLINGQTTSDAITFFRETAFTNAAAPVAEATATSGTSGLKPESSLTFDQKTEPVKTIATWIPITRQTLWDAAQLETYVDQRLMDFLRLEESDQILNGDGTGDNFTGILATTGRQVLDATYFTANPVNGVGNDNENFNRIRRAKTLVRTVGRATANFAVVNPADSEVFDVATTTNGNYYGAGPYANSGVPALWGMRVVEDENIPAGTALVGDGRMAAVWDRMQSTIITGYINDQLVRNMITLLAEERLALTVFRPQAFAVVSLA